MLAYILALAVGLGSIGLYLAAFFVPEIHRKNDFYWSGLGFFYALMLWVCAGRITGGVLLGQLASVSLLGWFGWQTLTLRRELTPVEQQTELPSKEVALGTVRSQAIALKDTLQSKLSNVSMPENLSELPQKAGGLLKNAKDRVQGMVSSAKQRQNQRTAKATPASSTPVQPKAGPTVTITSQPVPSTPAPTAEQPPQVREVPLGSEPPITTEEPSGPDMPGASGTEASIEEIAPEVELAPPAEPVGSGDPSDRANPPASPVAVEAMPVDMPETPLTPTTETPSAPTGEVPKAIHPNPPAPELVEEAVEDAKAKNLPSSPPEASAES